MRKFKAKDIEQKIVKIPDALKPAPKEVVIEETRKAIEKREKEMDQLFKWLAEGKSIHDIAMKQQYAESYIAGMAKLGKEGAIQYWKRMYGVRDEVQT